LLQDIRFALRLLGRNPAFAAIAIATLALGIGAHTAAFTVFNAFVLRPLPIRDPEALVRLSAQDRNGRSRNFSIAEYRDFRDRNDVFSDVIALNQLPVSLGDAVAGRAATDYSIIPPGYQFAFGLTVSGNYFGVLGGQPALGRLLTPDDDVTPGAHAVVVLSEGFWRRQFGGDPTLVGRTIRFNGRPYEMIGIAAGEFVGTQPNVPDFWVPLAMRGELHGDPTDALYSDRANRSVGLYGRLKPHVSPAQAAAAMNVLASSVAEGENPTVGIRIADASTFVSVKEFMPLIVPMSLAVGLVLVVACTNVANLLLARAAGKQREIEIRLAVGSSYRRLMRQLITESVVLGVLGGAAGLAASHWAIAFGYPAVLSQVPLPSGYKDAFTFNLNPDWRIFAFGVAVSIAAGILFGLAPAINSAKASVATAPSRFRDSMIVAQVAICLVLLVASGLLLRSMWFVEALAPGFQTARLYAASPGVTGESPSREQSVTERFASRLAELPEIQSLSVCYNQPLSGMSPQTGVDGTAQRVAYNSVGSRYFRTVGISLLRGRDFTEAEAKANAPVAIVSEGTASRVWPGEEALGKTIRLAEDGVPRQVIGVVSNARVGILWRPEDAYVYLPIGPRSAYTIFRAPSWSASVAESTLRDEASRIHLALRAPVRAIEDSLELAYAPFRFLAAMAGLIAALTLVLSSVGLYGVVSVMVSQRTREIGIRMALGAMSSDVMRTVFRSSLRLVAVGIAIGLGGGLAFAKLLAVALIGIKPFDLVAFASTSGLMVLVAALATWVPARRAARENVRCCNCRFTLPVPSIAPSDAPDSSFAGHSGVPSRTQRSKAAAVMQASKSSSFSSALARSSSSTRSETTQRAARSVAMASRRTPASVFATTMGARDVGGASRSAVA
jgi:predicted permease